MNWKSSPDEEDIVCEHTEEPSTKLSLTRAPITMVQDSCEFKQKLMELAADSANISPMMRFDDALMDSELRFIDVVNMLASGDFELSGELFSEKGMAEAIGFRVKFTVRGLPGLFLIGGFANLVTRTALLDDFYIET